MLSYGPITLFDRQDKSTQLCRGADVPEVESVLSRSS